MKFVSLIGYFLIGLTFSQSVAAAMIDNKEITVTTSLIESSYRGNVFSIEEIIDGISADLPSPYAGFASASTTGTIRFDFNRGTYDLTSFILYNDVNVLGEGIGDFRLDFYDVNDVIVNSYSGSAVAGKHEAQEFLFNTTQTARVDLVVLSAFHQIEIREVAFTANSSAVPEPLSITLLGLGLLGLSVFRKNKID